MFICSAKVSTKGQMYKGETWVSMIKFHLSDSVMARPVLAIMSV